MKYPSGEKGTPIIKRGAAIVLLASQIAFHLTLHTTKDNLSQIGDRNVYTLLISGTLSFFCILILIFISYEQKKRNFARKFQILFMVVVFLCTVIISISIVYLIVHIH
jgi:ABC-type multidrug transport system permease subunit